MTIVLPEPRPHSAHRPVRLSLIVTRLTLGTFLCAALHTMLNVEIDAAPHAYEQQRIEAEATEAFAAMITLWKDELYFELYQRGIAATRMQISREEFVQRMVNLPWIPQLPLNTLYLAANMRYRTQVYVKARLVFRHKFDATQRFARDQNTLLLKEDGQWRMDLLAWIRAPYTQP